MVEEKLQNFDGIIGGIEKWVKILKV